MNYLERKTGRYHDMLEAALDSVEDVEDSQQARQTLEMARAYLEDGEHFESEGEHAEALAAYSYGHGWLDSGARHGDYDVETEDL
ncbi:MAG: DUF357 domain-containing protein [Halobacteriota archaeon]